MGRGAARSSSRLAALQLPLVTDLEPHKGFPDVALFEQLAFPTWVLFWRRQNETMIRHRNPMLDPDIGIEPNLFAVDIMHALYLGCFNHM